MRPFVFLGGTVGRSAWRESVTQGLIEAGVRAGRIYNPVVANWTAESQASEDRAKRDSEYQLFYLCDVSGYSLVEATMGLYDRPASTLVVFDLDGIEEHVRKSLAKCERDMRERFPEGHIFSTADQAVGFLSQATRRVE